jgi:predicted alpha/beta-fold hydrolase
MSLGANRLLKLAGEERNCPFKAIVSVSNPFDLDARLDMALDDLREYYRMINHNFIFRPDYGTNKIAKYSLDFKKINSAYYNSAHD